MSLHVSLELIASSRIAAIQLMVELCQRVLDVLEMPAERSLSIMVPIFNSKCGIRYWMCYGVMKLLEHGMKVVKSVLEKYFVD